MYRSVCRSGFYLCSSIVVPRSFRNDKEKEGTGWERVTKMFELDEMGYLSPELSNIYNTTVLSAFFGACYGGFIHSRDAYLKFIENNEATKYADHFDAKKKLQNYVTVNFFKGALRWSWRLALFAGMYVGFVSVSSVYRGSHSVIDYIIAGVVSGGLYRVNYGVNGVIVGSTLGGLLGLVAGGCSTLLLNFGGNTFDDVADWHKEQLYSRERHLKESLEKSVLQKHDREMLSDHDEKIKVL